MRYTPISLNQIQEVLRADKGWKVNELLPGNEYVFEFALSSTPHIVIRVYSTIRKNDDNCRFKGADAIRVFAFNTLTRKGWIKTRRVLRVEGWRQNLTNAVTSVFEQSRARISSSNSNPFLNYPRPAPTYRKKMVVLDNEGSEV